MESTGNGNPQLEPHEQILDLSNFGVGFLLRHLAKGEEMQTTLRSENCPGRYRPAIEDQPSQCDSRVTATLLPRVAWQAFLRASRSP